MINDGGRGSNSGGVGADQTFAAHGYIFLYLRGVISEKTFPLAHRSISKHRKPPDARGGS